MNAGRRARPLVTLALAIAMVFTLFATPVDAVGAIPTLELFAASSKVTVVRNRQGFVWVDPGVWVTPVSGDFELRLSRPDYDTPFALTQVDSDTGTVLRTLPLDELAGLSGLSGFAHYRVADRRDHVVGWGTIDYCPNAYYRQRISDGSSLNPRYPYECRGGPFVKGQVWGIDEGWASSLFGEFGRLGFRAERNHYTIRFWIDPEWVSLLQIADRNGVAEIDATVVDRGELATRSFDRTAPTERPFALVPDVTNPDPSTLPDLVALPGWGMGTYSRKGRDYLAFGSTEWNEGPGTFVVEGFRRQDEDTMDGYQYFIGKNGLPTGRALIGELEFHAGGFHNHWHFEEFTRYSLLDASTSEVVVSGKQSWCLINTDAIDLTVPNASWTTYREDLSTSCGGPGALWIREVLDVGWGDTYFQSFGGQAFNITDLPNGTYYVRVHVNPTGAIFESDMDNNVQDRLIRLRGRPGHRRVVVPPWHGIDTEDWCYYCDS